MQKWFRRFLILLIVLTVIGTFQFQKEEITLPIWFITKNTESGINQKTLAVIMKEGDALSEKTAEHYLAERHIPKKNLFTISLPDTPNVSSSDFNLAYQKLKSQLPDYIQAMVITWNQPYRVDCMSITSAMTFGFDTKWCQPKEKGCQTTAISPYFSHPTMKPWDSLKIRPTMMLSGKNIDEIDSLISRGVKSDFSNPTGSQIVLVKTRDTRRSSRSNLFESAADRFKSLKEINVSFLDLSNEDRDFISGETLLGYQTGKVKVDGIRDNIYLPGAFADHLTSFGGAGLSEKGQMKAFRWLEAGATGSYGTVVEPCSYPAKFPDPNVLIPFYLSGETLLEAYWKSVRMPGEGLFIGEPLARPFAVKQ